MCNFNQNKKRICLISKKWQETRSDFERNGYKVCPFWKQMGQNDVLFEQDREMCLSHFNKTGRWVCPISEKNQKNQHGRWMEKSICWPGQFSITNLVKATSVPHSWSSNGWCWCVAALPDLMPVLLLSPTGSEEPQPTPTSCGKLLNTNCHFFARKFRVCMKCVGWVFYFSHNYYDEHSKSWFGSSNSDSASPFLFFLHNAGQSLIPTSSFFHNLTYLRAGSILIVSSKFGSCRLETFVKFPINSDCTVLHSKNSLQFEWSRPARPRLTPKFLPKI